MAAGSRSGGEEDKVAHQELALGAGSQLWCLKSAPHMACFTTASHAAGPLKWPLAPAGWPGFPYSVASGLKLKAKALWAFHS